MTYFIHSNDKKGLKKVKDLSKNTNEIIDLAKTFDNSVGVTKSIFGTGIT